MSKGAYIAFEPNAAPTAVILATGSEVSLALQAASELESDGIAARVVSMPSVERFAAQDEAYRESVLPNSIRNRVAVEASHADYWRQWVGLDGRVIGMKSFGESAPASELYTYFGITTDAVCDAVKSMY